MPEYDQNRTMKKKNSAPLTPAGGAKESPENAAPSSSKDGLKQKVKDKLIDKGLDKAFDAAITGAEGFIGAQIALAASKDSVGDKPSPPENETYSVPIHCNMAIRWEGTRFEIDSMAYQPLFAEYSPPGLKFMDEEGNSVEGFYIQQAELNLVASNNVFKNASIKNFSSGFAGKAKYQSREATFTFTSLAPSEPPTSLGFIIHGSVDEGTRCFTGSGMKPDVSGELQVKATDDYRVVHDFTFPIVFDYSSEILAY